MKTKRLLFLAASIVLVLVLVLVLAAPRSTAGQTLAPTAKPEARVTVGKREYRLTPDQVGAFGRVQVRSGALTPVRVAFPKIQPNGNIVAYTLDGGALDNGQTVRRLKPDAQGWVSFSFQSDPAAVRRVAVRNGKETKVLNFEVVP